jgi:hypothetical protein
LDINRTFKNQRNTVNRYIIPVVQKAIKKKFPVVDGIVKYIIHERHRHQREELLNQQRGADWNDTERRRRHANSRRSEVSKK